MIAIAFTHRNATLRKQAKKLVDAHVADAGDVARALGKNLEKQYELISLIAERSDVPVPHLAWLESDPSFLDQPFFVMHRVDGRVPTDIPPYAMDGWVRELGAEGQAALQRASVEVLAGLVPYSTMTV